jgi:hypothetical protein
MADIIISNTTDLLLSLIAERPKRKRPDGTIVIHFDSNGNMRRIEDVIPYTFKKAKQ